MQRRRLVAGSIAALVAPLVCFAQSKRVFRIAVLDDATESPSPGWDAFRNRLRELVLKDGNDVGYEVRHARGDPTALPKLARELVNLKPDLIVGRATPSTIAAKQATSVIPIFFLGVGDPVGTGLVASLSRPGGNATGVWINTPDIAGKHLELLRETAPNVTRVAFITVTSNQAAMVAAKRLQAHAQAAGITVEVLDGGRREALEQSFGSIRKSRAQGLILGMANVLRVHRQPIVQFAAREKLVAVYGHREYVEAGGLLSYSHDTLAFNRRGAELVHRILNGAKPGEIPVEQASTFRLLLNIPTAKALGISIPSSVRVRADEVIE